MSTGSRTCDPGTSYSRKIFSALLRTTASVETPHSMLHAAASESHSMPQKNLDTALDIVVHYIKPLSCGGCESSVVVVDLARRFDVLALAQQVDEPHLQDSLSRLHIPPMHRWHSPQANMQLAHLQELATAHGVRFYAMAPTVRLRNSHFVCE
ncbi:hypothetical protein MRX96_018315 [Rhipicephalus microplus]